eukprot:3431800-Alexandrium_andersonii.AAC.1
MARDGDFLGHDGEQHIMDPPPPPLVRSDAPPLSTEIPGRVLWHAENPPQSLPCMDELLQP